MLFNKNKKFTKINGIWSEIEKLGLSDQVNDNLIDTSMHSDYKLGNLIPTKIEKDKEGNHVITAVYEKDPSKEVYMKGNKNGFVTFEDYTYDEVKAYTFPTKQKKDFSAQELISACNKLGVDFSKKSMLKKYNKLRDLQEKQIKDSIDADNEYSKDYTKKMNMKKYQTNDGNLRYEPDPIKLMKLNIANNKLHNTNNKLDKLASKLVKKGYV